MGVTDPDCELEVAGTGAVKVPVGTENQRPTGTKGMLRFNDDDDKFEGHDGGDWVSVGGGPAADKNAIIRYNAQTINENITVPANSNGFTAGPITVASGKTVTISSGSSWKVF